MAYEQEWAQYQKILKDIEQANTRLLEAEAARNAAQPNQQDGQQQPDIGQLEAKVEQSRGELEAARTQKGAFELQVAQTNPEHARWLEEQLPPAQEQKTTLDSAQKNIDPKTAMKIAADVALEFTPIDPPTSEKVSEVIHDVIDNHKEMIDHTVAATQNAIEKTEQTIQDMTDAAKDMATQAALTAMDIVPTPPNRPEQISQEVADKTEQNLNEFYDNKEDALRVKTEAEVKWEKDIEQKEKGVNDSFQKQLDALEKNKAVLEKQKEGADEKKLEQLKPMDELIKKEEEKINNKLESSQNELNKEKEALQKAIDSAKQIESTEKQQAAIEEQRKVFEKQRELEKQLQLDHPNRK